MSGTPVIEIERLRKLTEYPLRRYERGIVLVNISNEPQTFVLPVQYRTEAGEKITSIQLPERSGKLLCQPDEQEKERGQWNLNYEVIIGWKGLPSFYPLLDDSFDCGLYIGGHAMAGTPHAVLPHTRTLVNDTPLGEVGAFALACGSLGIPMVFISGDQSVEKEVRALIPNVHSVVVKEAFSPYSAKILVPARARKLIRQEVEQAVSDRDNVIPFDLEKPYRIRIGDQQASGNNFIELFSIELLKHSPLGSQELDPQRQIHSEMRKQKQVFNYSK